MAIYEAECNLLMPIHPVSLPHGRWTDHPVNRRLAFHASPFAEPMFEWLSDPSREGKFEVTSRISGITYWFTDANTAMEFRMRFG